MNYYNEFDPKAVAWIRELIAAKLIPNGIVDERSIKDIVPSDLSGFTQCHFFAGIGGWSLALQLAGWPDDRPVWTGSCPCQPFSSAGQQKGQADERHLWPAFFDLIRECRPQHVFGEQVASAIGHGWLDGISEDLESEGYACGTVVLGAHSVSAPHIRQRLYWVADAGGTGLQGRERDGAAGTQVASCGHAVECGGALRMVDAAGGQREQCLRSQGDELQRPADNGTDGGMADSDGGDKQRSGSRIILHGLSAQGGNIYGVAGTSERAEEHQRLGDPASGGCGVMRDAPQPGGGRHAIGTGWARFEIVHCRDGKARRFERQSQQMADGIPDLLDAMRIAGASESEIQTALETFPLSKSIQGRVALLRGYGNAIVPEVAAEFIMAFIDTHKL